MRAGETPLVDPAPVIGVDRGDAQPVVRERLVPHGPDHVGGVPAEQPQPARRLHHQPVQIGCRKPALAVAGVPELDVAFDEAAGVALAHRRELQPVFLHGAELRVRQRDQVGAQPGRLGPAGGHRGGVLPRGHHQAAASGPVHQQLGAAQAAHVHDSGYASVPEFVDDRVQGGRIALDPEHTDAGPGQRTATANEDGHLVVLDRHRAHHDLGHLLAGDLHGLLAGGHRVDRVPVRRDDTQAEVCVGQEGQAPAAGLGLHVWTYGSFEVACPLVQPRRVTGEHVHSHVHGVLLVRLVSGQAFAPGGDPTAVA